MLIVFIKKLLQHLSSRHDVIYLIIEKIFFILKQNYSFYNIEQATTFL